MYDVAYIPSKQFGPKVSARPTAQTGAVSFDLDALELAVAIPVRPSDEGNSRASLPAVNNCLLQGHNAVLVRVAQLKCIGLRGIAARPLLLAHLSVLVLVADRKHNIDKIVARFSAR